MVLVAAAVAVELLRYLVYWLWCWAGERGIEREAEGRGVGRGETGRGVGRERGTYRDTKGRNWKQLG